VRAVEITKPGIVGAISQVGKVDLASEPISEQTKSYGYVVGDDGLEPPTSSV
jgi:hypothetical protein